MFILKEDKVVCFDKALQVLMLNDMPGQKCTKMVQSEPILVSAKNRELRPGEPPKNKTPAGCWRYMEQSPILPRCTYTQGVSISQEKSSGKRIGKKLSTMCFTQGDNLISPGLSRQESLFHNPPVRTLFYTLDTAY
jgi:hypothetical protein